MSKSLVWRRWLDRVGGKKAAAPIRRAAIGAGFVELEGRLVPATMPFANLEPGFSQSLIASNARPSPA